MRRRKRWLGCQLVWLGCRLVRAAGARPVRMRDAVWLQLIKRRVPVTLMTQVMRSTRHVG